MTEIPAFNRNGNIVGKQTQNTQNRPDRYIGTTKILTLTVSQTKTNHYLINTALKTKYSYHYCFYSKACNSRF